MKPLSRRTVLRGAGGIAVALPFLEAMVGRTRTIHAAEGDPPPRFIVFFSANGTIEERWRPVGTQQDFLLDDPSDPGRILAPLEAFKDRLIVLDGLDMQSRNYGPGGNGHDLGMGHMLTATDLVVGPSGVGEFSHLPDGSAGGPSIDQVVANTIGSETAFRSIEFGVKAQLDLARQITSRMCYRAPFEVLPPENDPRAAFDSFFLQLGADPSELAALRTRRHSVLDRVKEDFAALDAKLGGNDRLKLEAHLQAIREVEQSLDAEGGPLPGCTLPGEPGALDPLANDNYPEVGRLQMDLMTMALTCDITRVSSLQWSTAQSGVRFSWLGQSNSHHSLSHEADNDPASRAQLTAINNWYAEQFAYLLGKLAAQPELDGSLLDNTVVLWVNEQGNGDTHSKTEIPFVLAGNYAGQLDTGRWLQYTDRSHNDLYVALLNLFGNDALSFGNPQVNGGPLENLG
ncbi:MAG: DUF1552 domain-containing protein [Myxococcales bacterium]|nr:DUF1552 domain-containing protein [Myxococcales bacterium]MCB9718210.1 DUF1552 domain-containing protein [Myxococcales bacterium]